MTGGGQPCGEMDVLEKLTILTDAAKYDAACTSSGGNRRAKAGYIGNTTSSIAGCCHSFSADGRCVTLLKVLMTNRCVYDCKYCVNRRSNEAKRAMFTPEELADLTIQFYRRNYIEGLFLSSGVYRSPDYTTELMIRALRILREEYRFNGYIHAKAIPGTAPELVEQRGFLASTGCIRRTGCCGFTASGRRSCWMQAIRTSTPRWIPSAVGPSGTWTSSRWR